MAINRSSGDSYMYMYMYVVCCINCHGDCLYPFVNCARGNFNSVHMCMYKFKTLGILILIHVHVHVYCILYICVLVCTCMYSVRLVFEFTLTQWLLRVATFCVSYCENKCIHVLSMYMCVHA